MKIKKGDTVQILKGKDRDKRGKVLEINPRNLKVVIEGLNIRKKHSRPRKAGEKGQIVEFPASIPLANVSLVCSSCQKANRVGYRVLENGKKERICRKCSAVIST